MKPALPETDALVPRLRTQLILAQVRLMELEDVRDSLAARLEEAGQLQRAAQSLADSKVEESAHLSRVQADLQAQFVHMRHMQHVTQLALEETRVVLETAQRTQAAQAGELASIRTALDEKQQEVARLLAESSALSVLIKDKEAQLHRTASELAMALSQLEVVGGESAQRLNRITQLDAEQRAMKASRSWRWTAWLRSLERRLSP